MHHADFHSALISVFLMWPLGYLYGVLNWPTLVAEQAGKGLPS
jgi:hypothetical protein